MEVLHLVSWVVGVGAPTVALLAKVVGEGKWRGRVEARLQNIEAMLAARCEEDAKLHERVTGVLDRVAKLEGKFNGALHQ